MSESEIARQVRDAHRVRRGVCCTVRPETPEQWHVLEARAVLVTHHDGAYLSHVSAVLAHGLPRWRLPLARVHVMGATHGKNRRGIAYHDRLGEPVPTPAGLPATDVAQTVWDCARSTPLEAAVVLGDAALHRKITQPDDLEAVMQLRRRTKDAARAVRVLAALDGGAESPGESRGRLVLQELGYGVESQYSVAVEGHHYRADFWIVGSHVLVEVDGRMKYANLPVETVWREKVRADRIANLGFEIVRLTWQDLDHPAVVDRMVRRALSRRW